MVKKTKYSSQLTKEDHKVINHIILMCATFFVMILTRFDNNPKELGDYLYRKYYASKFWPAFNYLIANARFDPFFKQLFGSTQLNRKIANTLEWASDDLNEKRLYLHPREMTKLLKRLEKAGICNNIKGKKALKKEAKIDQENQNRFLMKQNQP